MEENMTRTADRTTNTYTPDHSVFGGIIYPSDFETAAGRRNHADGSPIARRILSDWNFDYQCKRNAKLREGRIGGSFIE